jgi:hypothetical protein
MEPQESRDNQILNPVDMVLLVPEDMMYIHQDLIRREIYGIKLQSIRLYGHMMLYRVALVVCASGMGLVAMLLIVLCSVRLQDIIIAPVAVVLNRMGVVL